MPRTDNQPSKPAPRWRVALLLALLAVGCTIFAWRGPARAVGPGGNYDFILVYSAARAWLHGENPYVKEAVTRAWIDSGGPVERDPMIARGPTTLVYPPPALAILAPVAALPWPIACWVWAIVNTVLAAWSLTALASLARLNGSARLALLALGMCMAPLVTNAGLGQTATVVFTCVCAAALARTGGHATFAGVLLGLGAALKPQLGFLFVVYEAGRLRWRTALVAGAVIVVLTGIGVGRMQVAGLDWAASWQRNIAAFTTSDDGSPAATNPIRHQIINLHYPLHNFTDDRDVVRWAVYGIAGALCAAYFVVDLKRRRNRGERPDELISLSFVSAVTLLVAYHRYYDAAILMVPLCLAVRGLADRQRRHATTMALVLVFALPLPVIAMEAARRGWIPERLVHTGFGQYLILPCQAWGLLLLALWLIWIRWKEPVTRRST